MPKPGKEIHLDDKEAAIMGVFVKFHVENKLPIDQLRDEDVAFDLRHLADKLEGVRA